MSEFSVGSGRTVVVTGGAGFVGSAVVRRLVRGSDHRVVTIDALTYAGDLRTLEEVAAHPRHSFERLDICDGRELSSVFERHRPDAVVHLAAESHVDRSIDASPAFVRTNVVGTATLLDVVRAYRGPADFRFVHVSTDEVYGDLPLETDGGAAPGRFDESTPYDPHSPYAATKAASDHFVRAWAHTYGLSAMVTHGTNTYGPWQYPEKLIPLLALRAMSGAPMPLYGAGDNVRDWIHVEDHAAAVVAVLERGRPGETYGIGSRTEWTNLSVAETICDHLDALRPRPDGSSHRDLISFVADRPGHDRRYATDPTKIETELGWRPRIPWQEGIRDTVAWMIREEDAMRARLRS